MKTMLKTVKDLIKKVKDLENSQLLRQENGLPSQCYFLNADEIVCYKRDFGDSRYPYSYDGRTLWVYSSGNIKIEESTFNIVLDFCEGKEPNLCFFAGVKKQNGYEPISLTGLACQVNERKVKRYTVFSPYAAYYFTETEQFTACVRMFIDNYKNIRFSLCIFNETDYEINTYLSSYFNCMLSCQQFEYKETKWYRSCLKTKNGFKIKVKECENRKKCLIHYAYITRDTESEKVCSTTSRTDFNGGMNKQLYSSISLQNGYFARQKSYTEFIDTAIAGDIIPIELKCGEGFCVSYTLAVSDNEKETEKLSLKYCKTEEIDNLLYGNQNIFGAQIPKIEFSGFCGKNFSDNMFNYFLKNVFRQTEFCARAKNYAGPYIGIRDIFQQLEAALLWVPDYCRNKIIEALNYIGENGRPPRQYSYPPTSVSLPKMDMRAYIDQGVWIISTVYTYLCYTSDFSILDANCGYYKFNGNDVDFSDKKDSVLNHLVKICNYLISNLDPDTGCLHILYGDWNDAIDGLGLTDDTDKEFGTGVSVMATLQLYKNLNEIIEILDYLGEYEDISFYQKIREKIKSGLQRYAIETNSKGERKIIYGWDDKMQHKVASFCDADGISRDGVTSNAFWVLSGAIEWDNSLKEDILESYDRLDSKYGIKTFSHCFSFEDKTVGRIINLPNGTAENCAVYIHATLFAIWSLFVLNEPKKAWEQIFKILPITHKEISTSPFVMPNSYVENVDLGFDGESMSDWFTGSGCVLLKVIIWQVLGFKADLNGLNVSPAEYIPFKNISASFNIKNATVDFNYKKTGNKRQFILNGKFVNKIYLTNSELYGKSVRIDVMD